MNKLAAKKFLFFVDDIYEDLELWYPLLRLQEEGATTYVAALEKDKKTYTGKHGYPAEANLLLSEALAMDFDGLVIPGGFMPDKLRRLQDVLSITKRLNEQNKLIAFICHAGWIPISAGIVSGRTVTSTPGIKDDLINAGATWKDEPVVIDKNFITARRPPDLPAFGKAIVEYYR